VESKWKNYHITTFPGQSLSKTGLSLEEAMDLSQDRQIEEEESVALYLGGPDLDLSPEIGWPE
jgi:hypothetical protein